MTNKKLIVVMGITGSGKSTIGLSLAERMGIPFIDADDFHPQSNVKKLTRGIPLDDDDRWPWLGAITEYVLQSHRNEFVLACSALKSSYREYLAQRLQNKYLFLELNRADAQLRLEQRSNHFMPSSLVDSQLSTLELPIEALKVDATMDKDEILKEALTYFEDFI